MKTKWNSPPLCCDTAVMHKAQIQPILSVAFGEQGAELTQVSRHLYTAKVDSVDYFVEIDNERMAFRILQAVAGVNGLLSHGEFDLMLDVVKTFHKDYDGSWNGGHPYVCSPWHEANEARKIKSRRLKRTIDDFFEVWSFACANATALTDT